MKTIKYFVIGAMLTIVGAPAMAQVDGKAAVNQVKEILKAKPADADKQISNIAKAFKKDGQTLTAIGREYLRANNYEKAEEFATLALAKNKKCGEAYILVGDVAIHNDNPGKAAEQFQQAMYMDPTNPEGYRRYANLMAKSSPSSSLDALEQLRQNVPGYPVDILAAEISDRAGDMKKAISYYNKVDKSKMENGNLGSYATDLFLTGDYSKALEVATYGANKAPRYAAFNRLALYNNTELKNYEEALAYGNKLFNASDSAKFSAFDYQYMGHAYIGAKKYNEAIGEFNKILSLDDANDDAKTDALRQIADAYSEMENYPEAIPAYEKYLAAKKDATATDYAGLGTICTLYANGITGAEQVAAVAKADEVYANLAARFEDAAEFAAFQRARVASITDPELKNGAAKPHYDKLIDIITTDGRIEGPSKTRLIQAYSYNMIYALQIRNDVAASKSYAQKLLEVDPENEQAKMVMTLK